MLLTVACGSGSSSTVASAPSSSAPASAPASSSPASSALCADAAALRAALDKLTQVKAGAGHGAVNEIKADLTGVKTALTSFATDAKGQFQSQTSGLKSALTSLETAVQKLAASPSTSGVTSVVTALGQVTAEAEHLFAAVGKDCPSAG